MAKLSVVELKPVPPPPNEYVLALSEVEMKQLLSIFGKIAGPKNWTTLLYEGFHQKLQLSSEDKFCSGNIRIMDKDWFNVK